MYATLLTPPIVFVTALGVSYVITRPIGNVRRCIGAILVSLLLGAIGSGIDAAAHEAWPYTSMMPVIWALVGSGLGVVLAWHRRTHPFFHGSSVSQSPHRSKVSKGMWHDHGLRRS